MLLKTTTDDLQLVTSAAGDIDVICEFADMAAAGTVTVDRDLTFAITTATTTEILPGVASNSRKVKHLTIRNVHASTPNTVTVLYNDNGTTGEEVKVPLLAGELLEYVDGKGWQVLDANGYVKTGPPPFEPSLLLSLTTDKIQLVTGSSGDVDTIAYYEDLLAGGSQAEDRQHATITTAATTDIVASPGAGAKRNVRRLIVRNTHASTSNLVTVLYNANGTVYEEAKATLLFGEQLEYTVATGWRHLDANGYVLVSAQVPAASDTVAGILTTATQAEMEAAASLTSAVTPGRQNFHPGMTKCWLKCGVAANVLASHNITGVADTGAGAVTVTVATDFSSAHWSCSATIELASTVIAQSCTYDAMAAGTVILRSVVEAGSATDPVTWSMQGCGDQ